MSRRKAPAKRVERAEPAEESEAEAAAVEAPPPPERQPDFIWSGSPVYRCHQGCGDRFERLGDLAAVLEHERTMHPTNANERPSLILGADGRPLKVKE